MEAPREFSGNTVGDHATVYQGNITENINIEISDAHSTADDEFLQEISKTNPIIDKERILASKGPLLYESFCWILEHDHFRRWRNTRNGGVLWIKGEPGKGKTMLLCGIIGDLEKDSELRGKLAYFFCQGTDNRINTAAAVVKGLIFSLLRQHRGLLSRIRKQNEKEPKGQLEGPNAWFALCRIFKSVVQDPCITDPICVIDALDECQNEKSLDLLLALVVETSKHVKWLLSSRNEQEIEWGLESIESHQRLVLELKGNAEYISKAVEMYIDYCIRDIRALKRDEKLRTKTVDLLKKKANGTFLWVTLVVQQLRGTRRWNIERELQKMPEGLGNLYNEIMKRARERWGDDERACLVLLATVTAAERPLHLEELYVFISPQVSSLGIAYSPDDVTDLAKACGSFISIRDDTVYFIHQSVKDYMVQDPNASILPLGIEHQHYRMFEISLCEMDNTLKRDIYDIKLPGAHIDGITPPDSNPLASRGYCCTFWIEHLAYACQSQQIQYRECLKDSGTLYSFLKERFLYWLEAMALLKSMSRAAIAIQELRDLVVNCYWEKSDILEVKQMLGFTREAHRFILAHRATIEAFHLQIYASALIFSPTESILRKLFEERQSPEWIITKPNMQPNWSACIQTIESHDWVSSVAFSPNSVKLASASGDGAKIWDLNTGAYLQTLKCGKTGAHDAVFSPDGTKLALAGLTNIQIWDLTTSTCLKTIQDSAWSVTFSADGARLAILNHFNKVKFHDLDTNLNLQTYTCRPDEHFDSVVFLSDRPLNVGGGSAGTQNSGNGLHAPALTDQAFCARLAVMLETTPKDIEIWDIVDGQCMKTKYSNISLGEDVHSLVLSSDGAQVAVTGGRSIRVWDLATRHMQTLKEDGDSVMTMEFSPDGMWLAAADLDVIKIWDIATGECLRIFEGHTDEVISLAFSPDGSRLASGGEDRTVRVWDLAVRTSLDVSDDRGEYAVLQYSPNGMLLASGSYKFVGIWDPVTGECRRKFEVLISTHVLAFSPDGMRLAAGGWGGDIIIWDPTTGVRLQTIQHQTDIVSLLAFSSSGTQLASISDNNTMKIWDLTTGNCLRTINITSFNPDLEIILSSDGTQLKLVSAESCVQIWDQSTGICLLTLDKHAISDNPRLRRGIFGDIEQSVDCGSNIPEIGISRDKGWILRQQQPVIRLPPEYRPGVFAAYGNSCAISCSSNKVLFFQFNLDALDAEIKGW